MFCVTLQAVDPCSASHTTGTQGLLITTSDALNQGGVTFGYQINFLKVMDSVEIAH